MNRSREDIYVPYDEEASMMRSDEEVDDEYDDDHDDDGCVAAAPAQASIFLPAPITTVRARQDLCPKPNYAPVTVNDDDEDDVAGTCGTSPSHGATPPTKYLTTSARMAHHDHDRGHDHDGDDDVAPQMISLSSNSQAFWERPRSALYEPTAATAAKQHERTHTHKTSSPHSARKPPFLASGTAPSSGRRYSHATYEAAGSTYGRNDTTPTKYGGTYNNNNNINNNKKRGCVRTFSPISTLSPRSAPQPQSQQTFVRKATMTPERKQSCDVRSLESFARHCSRQEAGRHDQYERTTPRYVRDAEASMASTEGGIELDGVRRKGARSRRGSSASSRPRASSANGGRLSRSQSCVSGLDPTTTTTTTLMRSNSTHKRGGAATRTSSTSSSARKAETPSGYRCITTGGARKKTKKTNNNNKKEEVLTQHTNNGINQLSATPAKEESPAAVRCTWATSPGAIERMLVEDGEVEDELRRTGGAENARWSMSATKPRAPKSRGEMDGADDVGGATPTYGTTTTKGEDVDGCPAHIGSDPVLHVMLRGMIRFAMPCRLCGELLSDASYFNHVEMCATRTHDLLSAYYHARIPPHMTAVLRTAMDPLPPAMCANTNTNTNNVRSDAAWQCYHSARAMLVQCGVCRASIRVHDWREHEDQCRGTMRLPAQDPSPQHVKEEGNVRVC